MKTASKRIAARMQLSATMTFVLTASIFCAIGSTAATAKSPAATISSFLKSLTGSSDEATTERTRFIIELDRNAKFKVFALNNPNRIVVELPDVRMRLPQQPRGKAVGLVKSFLGGQSAPGKSRVIINVTAPVVIESANLLKPTANNARHQLVLDIMPAVRKKRPKWMTATAGFSLSKLGAGRVQPPLPQKALTPAQRRASRFKPVIVLDPGHGGRDTGATKNGAVESRVVLAFAHVLRKKLEASGRYKVLMTRDKDVFIPLGKRVDFAEKNKAALFIAIHADYAGAKAQGATIYSLRSSTAAKLRRKSGRVSANEVLTKAETRAIKRDVSADYGTITNILADLATRETQVTNHRTDVFSRTVIRQMGKATTMRSKPHQRAGFRVLRTAKMPSVLIELAYVTNRRDAARLKSKVWRNKVAGSIGKAIDNYFSHRIARLPM